MTNLVAAVMRETLRLAPTAAMRSVAALEDTTLGNGMYAIQKDQIVALNIYMVHRDPKIWGEDVSYLLQRSLI